MLRPGVSGGLEGLLQAAVADLSAHQLQLFLLLGHRARLGDPVVHRSGSASSPLHLFLTVLYFSHMCLVLSGMPSLCRYMLPA